MRSNFNLGRRAVVDLEATCWDTPVPASREFKSEIIEIGVCLVDFNKSGDQRVKKESILVKPQYSKIGAFCTKLTTLTQADVDAGHPLADACNILVNGYDTKNITWASFGDYDRNKFHDECKDKRIPYPFGPRHINIKNLFALMYRLPKEVGLPEALKILGYNLEGTHHRGVDDAWNIARIACKLLEKKE